MSDIEKLVKDSYYINSNMIEFLIVENLALKSLLHEKGIINPEEYKKHQSQSFQLVENRVNEQIEQWKKNNPKIFDVLNNLHQSNRPDLHLKDDAVVS